MEYIYKVVCFSLTSTKNNNNKDSNLYNNALNFMSSKSKYIDRNYLSDINNFLYYIFILIKLINESFFFSVISIDIDVEVFRASSSCHRFIRK